MSTLYYKCMCVCAYIDLHVYMCVCESITAFLWRVRCISFCTKEAFLTEGSFVSFSYWELQAEKQVSAGSATSHTHTHIHTCTQQTFIQTRSYISVSACILSRVIHACMDSTHASGACRRVQRLFTFCLPNVTQLHPPSTRSQTSYQKFPGCLSGSGI